jgi:hypothetical protein
VNLVRHIIELSIIALVLGSACASNPSGSEQAEDDSGTADGTETGGACEPPANATPDQMAVISITNTRNVPIYVIPYSSFGCNYGKVEISVGDQPVLWQHDGTYADDCSGPLCDWGCSDGGSQGLIINPGATAEVEWNGGMWTETPLSDACRAEAACDNDPGPTCRVLEVVEGTYLARVNLTDTCPIPDECMACTEGVCEVFFYEPSAAEVTESFSASAVFPEGASIVFQ